VKKKSDLPECKYRRYTRKPELIRLHCFLKREDCTIEECAACPNRTPETGTLREMVIDGQVMLGYFHESPDPTQLEMMSARKTWIVEHSDATRPDLQAIRASLPRQRGKHRKFIIEDGGAIVYAQEEGDWEPPRDINGYQRDPENPWRFIPLWPKCLRRMPKGTRTKRCGCLQLTMVCDNPASELHTKTVTDAECQQCPVRAQGE